MSFVRRQTIISGLEKEAVGGGGGGGGSRGGGGGPLVNVIYFPSSLQFL